LADKVRIVRFSSGIAISVFTVAFAAPSKASSLVQAIVPNEPVQQGLQFDVSRVEHRQRSRPKTSEFKVEITPKDTQLPEEFTASSSSVRIESDSTDITDVRQLDCTTEQTVVCSFTVPDIMLETLDLEFVLTIPVFINNNG
jgi:hypothetical protein